MTSDEGSEGDEEDEASQKSIEAYNDKALREMALGLLEEEDKDERPIIAIDNNKAVVLPIDVSDPATDPLLEVQFLGMTVKSSQMAELNFEWAQWKVDRARKRIENQELVNIHLRRQYVEMLAQQAEADEAAGIKKVEQIDKRTGRKIELPEPPWITGPKAVLEKLVEDLKICEANLEKALTVRTNFSGPQGLQKLVRERRKRGVPMPFTVDVLNGAQYIIVRWNDNSSIRDRGESWGGGSRPSTVGGGASRPDTALSVPSTALSGLTHDGTNRGTDDPANDPKSGLNYVNPVWRLPGGWSYKMSYGDYVNIMGVRLRLVKENAASQQREIARLAEAEDADKLVFNDGYDCSEDEESDVSEEEDEDDDDDDDDDDDSDEEDNEDKGVAGTGKASALVGVSGSPGSDAGRKKEETVGSGESNGDGIGEEANDDRKTETASVRRRRKKQEAKMREAREVKIAKRFPPEFNKVYDDADRIWIDRPWLLESMLGVPVHKVVTLSSYAQPLQALTRSVTRSVYAQKTVSVAAVLTHKTSALCKYVGSLFDEESDTATAMRIRSARLFIRERQLLKLCRLPVTVESLDFALRRR